MLKSYYPEMGEAKPEGVIEATMSRHGAKHWHLWTPLALTGRGIVPEGRCESLCAPCAGCGSINLEPCHYCKGTGKPRRAGWNRYKVTDTAFEKICAAHDVVTESLL